MRGNENVREEISMFDYVEVLGKYWKFILGVSLVSAVVAFLSIINMPGIYKAQAILHIGRIGKKPLESILATSSIIKSLPNIKQIEKEFGGKPLNLINNIIISEIADQMIVETMDIEPERAERLGQIVCDVIIKRHDILYNKAKTDLQKFNIKLPVSVQLNIELNEMIIESTYIEVQPVVQGGPIGPRKRNVVVMTFIITLVCAVFLAFAFEDMKRKRNINKV